MDAKVKLSKRLTAITEFVPKGSTVADIGCDHGFVSIYLIQQKIAQSVIASDVNEGPLERAREHVFQYALADYIQLRLADGMNGLTIEDQVSCAVIAGMGGRMMIHILSEAKERGLFVKNLVLQPQSEWIELRGYLRELGYLIVDENMILEDGKYYPVLKVCLQAEGQLVADEDPSEKKRSKNQGLEDAFGPVLLSKKHPVLMQYLTKELDKFLPIYEKLAPEHKSYGEMTEKIHRLQAALSLMEE